MCAQSIDLGICKAWIWAYVHKLQLEIIKWSTISAIHKFEGNILESLQNISHTHPWGTFYYYGLTLILAWISNHTLSKV